MHKMFDCCYENSDVSKWQKINIFNSINFPNEFELFFKKLEKHVFPCGKKMSYIYRMFLKSPHLLLKGKNGFNAKNNRGDRSCLRNKLD